MWACASPNACGGCRQDLAPATFGLRADRRKEIAQHAPHSVQLIDEIEDDGNAVLVHAEFPQVADQLHSCEIDLGKWPGFAAIARQQENYDLSRLDWPRVDASGSPRETLARARAAINT